MADLTQVRRATRARAVTRGTANVFADLGFPDAVERQAKLRTAYALNQMLATRQLSRVEAVEALGITTAECAALLHYKLAGFSVERLMDLLTPLDQHVEIVIPRKNPRRRERSEGAKLTKKSSRTRR